MNPPELEDNWYDVVTKAAFGLEISLEAEGFPDLDENDPPNEKILQELAELLNLHTKALIHLAHDPQIPRVTVPDWVERFSSQWRSMIVNAYKIAISSQESLLFDTGTDSGAIDKCAKQSQILQLFITHSHHDHIACLDSTLPHVSGSAWSCVNEWVEGTERFSPGHIWDFAPFRIESRLTCGHAKAGITYLVSHTESMEKVAVVGDAIFACSMGGGKVDYQAALSTNKSEIMSLEDETILLPGHGFPTSVGHERQWNPFLAEL